MSAGRIVAGAVHAATAGLVAGPAMILLMHGAGLGDVRPQWALLLPLVALCGLLSAAFGLTLGTNVQPRFSGLLFAVVLAAGMKGIEEGYELPAGAEDDVWSLTERERQALGMDPLPKSLYDAIGIAERSELLAETLGEHVFDFFLRNKRAEWAEYRRQVTPFELARYLPVL